MQTVLDLKLTRRYLDVLREEIQGSDPLRLANLSGEFIRLAGVVDHCWDQYKQATFLGGDEGRLATLMVTAFRASLDVVDSLADWFDSRGQVDVARRGREILSRVSEQLPLWEKLLTTKPAFNLDRITEGVEQARRGEGEDTATILAHLETGGNL